MFAEGEGAFFGMFMVFALLVVLGILANMGYLPGI